MTMTIEIAPYESGDLTPYLLPNSMERHRRPEVLFRPESTTLVLPVSAPPAPRVRATRVYLPANTDAERPLLGRPGEHRRQAPTWAVLALGAGLGLLSLAAGAAVLALAVLA